MGRHAQNIFGNASAGTGSLRVSNPFRVLTFEQLRLIYQRTPDVRSSIDQIVRKVATWDWVIEPTVDPKDERHEDLQTLSTAVTRFLQAPNKDGEVWQEVWTKTLTDLLIYDAGVEELVSERVNNVEILEEIVPLKGSDIQPITDEFGRLLFYEQTYFRTGVAAPGMTSGTAPVRFHPEQILYLRLFPNTEGPEGFPLIESIVNEVVAILKGAEHVMHALDADEIPPGILILSGLAREAAKEATADLKRMRGQDHKIRVVTTKSPTGIGANWVELRHTPKELTFSDVMQEIRRTIWRVFGVLPVEMGATDGMPRATAQVQLDVSNSHLLTPILDLLEAKINTRILPLLIPDPDLVSLVRFRFDRDRDLSADELKAKGETLVGFVKEGILTRNEAREELNKKPYGPEGDVPTVRDGATVVPLVAAVLPAAPEEPDNDEPPDDEPPDDDGGIPDDGVDDGESDDAPGEPDSDRTAATRALWSRGYGILHREKAHLLHTHSIWGCDAGCDHSEPTEGPESPTELYANGLSEDLPSDWQPQGRFKDVRTVDLSSLWQEVAGYTRDVEPLYNEAESSVLSIIRSEYRAEGLAEDELTRLRNRIGGALDELVEKWSLTTAPRYRRISKIGRDAAVDWTTQQVVEDWAERGQAYGDRAMQFLNRSDGLVGTLRTRLFAILAAVSDVRSMQAPDVRAAGAGVVPDLDQDASLDDVVEASMQVFASEKHRIANWSGKTLELAYLTLGAGLNQVVTTDEVASAFFDDEAAEPVEDPGGAAIWVAEWVNVGDSAMCATCTRLGSRGFIPMSVLPTVPGGDTECRARCRCVLVLWTQAEVDSGTAELLGGGNTGTVLGCVGQWVAVIPES